METVQTTLTDFLLARIAEDELQATAQIDNWADETGDDGVAAMTGLRADTEYRLMRIGAGRVLAECEAKRRLVALHEDVQWNADPDPDEPGERTFGCYTCHGPCGILLALAAPYADHPDYRDEWRP